MLESGDKTQCNIGQKILAVSVFAFWTPQEAYWCCKECSFGSLHAATVCEGKDSHRMVCAYILHLFKYFAARRNRASGCI